MATATPRINLLPFAHFLHQAGFSVLTYNMRSRGGSGGSAVSLGALDRPTLSRRWIFSPNSRRRMGQPGAGAFLGRRDEYPRCRTGCAHEGVVDDSGFSDAPNVIQTAFSHFIHLPAFPVCALTVGLSEQRIGVSITDVRPWM